jgi:phosphatidate cytidylyltransferase
LIQRIISGIWGLLVLAIFLIAGARYPFIVRGGFSVVTILAIKEIAEFKNFPCFSAVTLLSMIFSVTRYIFGAGPQWQASVYIYSLAMFVIAIRHFLKNKKSVWNMCFLYTLTLITCICLSKITETGNIASSYPEAVFYILLTLGIAWMCDTGAYFSGVFFGKKKLCPEISPKKTVEGTVGGAIAVLAFVNILGLMFKFILGLKVNFVTLSILSIFGAPLAILGDLCFSIIKRTAKVKDFGDIMPGHGGVLDRFDSVIFTAPYVYVFLHFFKIVG